MKKYQSLIQGKMFFFVSVSVRDGFNVCFFSSICDCYKTQKRNKLEEIYIIK